MEKRMNFSQVTRWIARGLLVKVRKGYYLLNEADRRIEPSSFFIAGQIYSPSYVSCESALAYYDLIPERVYGVLSVTTRKTGKFDTPQGFFSYHHGTFSCFRGFRLSKDENGSPFSMAEPEKAVVDFLYYRKHTLRSAERDIFVSSFRFQNYEALDVKKLGYYASLFNSAHLAALVKSFCNFIKEESDD